MALHPSAFLGMELVATVTPKGLPWWLSGKESACQFRSFRRPGLELSVRKIPWSRKWQPAPVSGLDNPRDRGAWWAAAHGVANRWTGLSTHTDT